MATTGGKPADVEAESKATVGKLLSDNAVVCFGKKNDPFTRKAKEVLRQAVLLESDLCFVDVSKTTCIGRWKGGADGQSWLGGLRAGRQVVSPHPSLGKKCSRPTIGCGSGTEGVKSAREEPP